MSDDTDALLVTCPPSWRTLYTPSENSEARAFDGPASSPPLMRKDVCVLFAHTRLQTSPACPSLHDGCSRCKPFPAVRRLGPVMLVLLLIPLLACRSTSKKAEQQRESSNAARPTPSASSTSAGSTPTGSTSSASASRQADKSVDLSSGPSPSNAITSASGESTYLLVHNVIIHTNARLQMKVKWMRARIYPTRPGVTPSFDDLNTFHLQILEGLVGMNVSDFTALLRNGALTNSAIKNLKVEVSGAQLKLSGSYHKIIPVQMLADVSASPDHKSVRLQARKIDVLKLPFKKLLGALHIHAADFVGDARGFGIIAHDDTIDIDVNRLLPAPRVSGPLNEVKVWKTGELMQYYGAPREDAIQVSQWRNFMHMIGGQLSFGKITMNNTDLLLIDISQADWLHFDVQNYSEQLVNGETHITPSGGLQIFIPDLAKIPASKRNRDITVQWMKNRNTTPPEDKP